MENNDYIVITGDMVNNLGLKGNELLVFALINGFTKDGETWFNGTLGYISDWLNISTKSVQNTLKNLIEKELIEKEEYQKNNIKFCRYRKNFVGMEKFSRGMEKFSVGQEVIKETIQEKVTQKEDIVENIQDNNKYKDNNIVVSNATTTQKKATQDVVKPIIEYLNLKANKTYKSSTNKTIDCITARINEGFVFEDFKKVIDNKCVEWSGTEWEKFLRPETLFGNKFEGYLQQSMRSQKPKSVSNIMSMIDFI